MNEQKESLPSRRLASSVTVDAGIARGGRTPYLLAGQDLILALGRVPVTLRCRRRSSCVPPAHISIVGAGEVMVLEAKEATPYRAVHLPPGLLGETVARGRGAAMVRPEHRVSVVVAAPGLCEAIDERENEVDLVRLVERVVGAARVQVQHIADEEVRHAVVRRIRDHLRAFYTRKITLDELGQMSGMCRFALVRAFTREIGIPPHSYQTYLRVVRARELIAAGKALSDVSLEVGFTDQSHLTRHFKRILGTTPGRVRAHERPRMARSITTMRPS